VRLQQFRQFQSALEERLALRAVLLVLGALAEAQPYQTHLVEPTPLAAALAETQMEQRAL